MNNNEEQSSDENMNDAEAAEFEVRRPQLCKSQIAPSKQEQAGHNITHLPFRGWCRHCLRAKARALAHRTGFQLEEQLVPLISFDYAFMNSTMREQVVPLSEIKLLI